MYGILFVCFCFSFDFVLMQCRDKFILSFLFGVPRMVLENKISKLLCLWLMSIESFMIKLNEFVDCLDFQVFT